MSLEGWSKRRRCAGHIFMNEPRVMDCDISCGLWMARVWEWAACRRAFSFPLWCHVAIVDPSSKQVITFFKRRARKASTFHLPDATKEHSILPASLNRTLILYRARRKVIIELLRRSQIYGSVYVFNYFITLAISNISYILLYPHLSCHAEK